VGRTARGSGDRVCRKSTAVAGDRGASKAEERRKQAGSGASSATAIGKKPAEVGAASESPLARSGATRSQRTSLETGSGGGVVVGLALRCALNAPPFGLRRAPLRARPTTKETKDQNQKGDISNEVSKGTFLTRFDTKAILD
jgi:hypothetical protein